MKEPDLEYRMYGLVPYNISPIQQGIQFGHAVVEYINQHFNVNNDLSGMLKWMKEDKTFIILNGGTTNTRRELGTGNVFGSLNGSLDTLNSNNITLSTFHEPDLGDQLTAVVFLVDERVFDKKKYPDFDTYCLTQNRGFQELWLSDQYNQWINFIGGEKNKFLREFLKQFKLA